MTGLAAWGRRWYRFARTPARGLGASDHATRVRRGIPQGCTCGDTGWATTITPAGVMQRPCRDCLGPPGKLP